MVARQHVDPAARTVLAMLDTWTVRGHAVAGNAKAAAATLNQADELWTRRVDGDDPGWAYWMPQPSLTAEAGTALLEIGDLTSAERALTAGLATLDGLDGQYLRAHHHRVVDSGFYPTSAGPPRGDVHGDAVSIPQNITPVPGGVGRSRWRS